MSAHARDFWVEANLKETDLTYLEVGQIATLQVDAYPDVVWDGVVLSVSTDELARSFEQIFQVP